MCMIVEPGANGVQGVTWGMLPLLSRLCLHELRRMPLFVYDMFLFCPESICNRQIVSRFFFGGGGGAIEPLTFFSPLIDKSDYYLP